MKIKNFIVFDKGPDPKMRDVFNKKSKVNRHGFVLIEVIVQEVYRGTIDKQCKYQDNEDVNTDSKIRFLKAQNMGNAVKTSKNDQVFVKSDQIGRIWMLISRNPSCLKEKPLKNANPKNEMCSNRDDLVFVCSKKNGRNLVNDI